MKKLEERWIPDEQIDAKPLSRGFAALSPGEKVLQVRG